MKSIEVAAKTREEAIEKALRELGAERHEVAVEIIDEGSSGFLGFGARDVKIRVSAEHLDEQADTGRGEAVEVGGGEDDERPSRGRRSRRGGRGRRGRSGRDSDNGGGREQDAEAAGDDAPRDSEESARRPKGGDDDESRDASSEDGEGRGSRSRRRGRRGGRGRGNGDSGSREQEAASASEREERPSGRGRGRGRRTQDRDAAPAAKTDAGADPAAEEPALTEAELGAAGSLLAEMIRLMGFEATVTPRTDPYFGQLLDVQSEDSAMLIGRKGRNLDAMQYLLNRLLQSEEEAPSERVCVDVEEYRQRRRDSLEEMAERMAAKVRETGRRVRVKPLEAPERRVVHLALQDDEAVTTFSVGSGAARCVMIAPAGEEEAAGDDDAPQARGGRDAEDDGERGSGGRSRRGGRGRGRGRSRRSEQETDATAHEERAEDSAEAAQEPSGGESETDEAPEPTDEPVPTSPAADASEHAAPTDDTEVPDADAAEEPDEATSPVSRRANAKRRDDATDETATDETATAQVSTGGGNPTNLLDEVRETAKREGGHGRARRRKAMRQNRGPSGESATDDERHASGE